MKSQRDFRNRGCQSNLLINFCTKTHMAIYAHLVVMSTEELPLEWGQHGKRMNAPTKRDPPPHMGVLRTAP